MGVSTCAKSVLTLQNVYVMKDMKYRLKRWCTDIAAVDARVIKIVDIKTPGSHEVEKSLPNMQHLLPHDQIKFVFRCQ